MYIKPTFQLHFVLMACMLLLNACNSDLPWKKHEKDPMDDNSGKNGGKKKFSSKDNNNSLDSTVAETDSMTRSFEQNVILSLYEDNGLYGYMGEDGSIVLEAKYEMATDFVNGMAEVLDKEGWAIINMQGDIIVRPLVVDNGPDFFIEGLTRFVENGKIGFVDDKGRKVIPAQFDFAKPFKNGVAAACMGCKQVKSVTESGEQWKIRGGKWGFIDKSGVWVIPCQYEAVREFNKGAAEVKENDHWLKVDKEGKQR